MTCTKKCTLAILLQLKRKTLRILLLKISFTLNGAFTTLTDIHNKDIDYIENKLMKIKISKKERNPHFFYHIGHIYFSY